MNRREKIRGLLPVLKNRQAVMDDTIGDLKKNHGPTTCDSCTAPGCCYQKTMVQLAEALLIAQDLKTRALPEPKTMTKKQAAIVVGVELALMGLMAWGKYRRYQRESTSR